MKKFYITPETEICPVAYECMLTTDSEGLDNDFCAKENNLMFDDDDDNFGDTWGVDSNNLWGDEDQ